MSGQLWATNSLGGYLASQPLSKKVRHAAQPLMFNNYSSQQG